MPRHVIASFLAVILSAAFAHGARAEVVVQGKADAMVVNARDASVQDVLAALGTSFGLHYRGADALERRVSGTWRGSLQHVVRRVLDGYDFVLKTDKDEVEVVVIAAGGTSGGDSTGVAAAIDATAQGVSAKMSTPRERRQRRRAH